MEYPIRNRHRIKPSPVTKLWARVWRDAVIEAKRREDCRCDIGHPCMCRKATDYSLSLMFQPEPRDGYSPSERLRLFEKIASHGKLPADGTHPKRNGYDIVDEVGKRPGYAWTKEIFESPFWYLLLNPGMNAQQLSKFIVQCLISAIPHSRDPYELINVRESENLGPAGVSNLFPAWELTLRKAYSDAFPHSVYTKINLDYLAMLGALFKDAYLAGALHMALLLEEAFLNKLNSIEFNVDWMSYDNHTELIHLTKNIVLRSHSSNASDHPNIIEIYRENAADEVKDSAIRFLQVHQDRIKRDYHNPRNLNQQSLREAYLKRKRIKSI